MPMPRLTSIPAFSSWAMRRAMISCGLMLSSRIADEVINDRSRRDDVIWRDDTDRDDMLGACYDDVACHGHDRVVVAGGEGIGEIAKVVRKECMYEGEVGAKCDLDQV